MRSRSFASQRGDGAPAGDVRPHFSIERQQNAFRFALRQDGDSNPHDRRHERQQRLRRRPSRGLRPAVRHLSGTAPGRIDPVRYAMRRSSAHDGINLQRCGVPNVVEGFVVVRESCENLGGMFVLLKP